MILTPTLERAKGVSGPGMVIWNTKLRQGFSQHAQFSLLFQFITVNQWVNLLWMDFILWKTKPTCQNKKILSLAELRTKYHSRNLWKYIFDFRWKFTLFARTVTVTCGLNLRTKPLTFGTPAKALLPANEGVTDSNSPSSGCSYPNFLCYRVPTLPAVWKRK